VKLLNDNYNEWSFGKFPNYAGMSADKFFLPEQELQDGRTREYGFTTTRVSIWWDSGIWGYSP
jgi:hypothetical protein